MLKDITLIITTILSILAFALSLVNFLLEKKKLVSQFIASNRMDWIKEVRELLFDFTKCYYQGKSKEKLRICKIKIDMYTRMNDPAYNDLNNIMEKCIENEFCMEDYNKLIESCQFVLGAPWKRMKAEAGISSRIDTKYREHFFKRVQEK